MICNRWSSVSMILLTACCVAQGAGPSGATPALVYLGAFRLPNTPANGSSFAYGGQVACCNPSGNRGKGSLLIQGHMNEGQQFAEISIPSPGKWIKDDHVVKGLPTATYINGFSQLATPWFHKPMSPPPHQGVYDNIRGICVDSTRAGAVYFNVANMYAVNGKDYFHFAAASRFGDPAPAGISKLAGQHTNMTAGYLTDVPPSFARDKLNGRHILTGAAGVAGAGTGSWGPAAFAISPVNSATGNPWHAASDIPNTPLVYYPKTHPHPRWANLTWGCGGAAWLGNDLIFSVLHGVGTYWYGGPTTDAQGKPNGLLDPYNSSKGPHCPDYTVELWFYAQSDIARVAAGELQPWQIMPYKTMDIKAYWRSPYIGRHPLAVDRSRGILYWIDLRGDRVDGAMPLVHVWQAAPSSERGA